MATKNIQGTLNVTDDIQLNGTSIIGGGGGGSQLYLHTVEMSNTDVFNGSSITIHIISTIGTAITHSVSGYQSHLQGNIQLLYEMTQGLYHGQTINNPFDLVRFTINGLDSTPYLLVLPMKYNLTAGTYAAYSAVELTDFTDTVTEL